MATTSENPSYWQRPGEPVIARAVSKDDEARARKLGYQKVPRYRLRYALDRARYFPEERPTIVPLPAA